MIWSHASWILPIAGPPIRDGWVATDGGRIVAVGRDRADGGAAQRDLGHVAVLPGLVNAHTHLELSYLRGELAPARAFVTWVRALLEARRQQPDPRAPHILSGVEAGIREARASGTALVGDISNTLVTYDVLARSSLAAVVFYELLRFTGQDADLVIERACAELDALQPTRSVKSGLAAHAPYSVSPRLFGAIKRATDSRPGMRCSVHLAESKDETEFVMRAHGPWRTLLEELNVWDPTWAAPAVTPVEYLASMGFLSRRVLAVHCVQADRADLARLATVDATLVTCPRSNARTGAGLPPVEAFYQAGVRVAVGTDSLASTPDLNMFTELAALRALAPAVPASVLLDSATRQGAVALGFDGEYGTITPGASARLVAVQLPATVRDVEEYLVSGIDPTSIDWIE